MNDLLNTQLGPYRLTEVSGRGGMATVYKAYQPSLDRYVAIKVLPRVQDPLFAARFKREARALAQIQHPNILPIHDYGEQDDLLYLVLQYIENGVTLGDMLGKPIEPTRALRLVGRVLDALDYAHARGVIHRDIKPSNILMSSPTWPLLADFGIAKLLTDTQHLTISGQLIGTVAYMAPEQAISTTIDARADLYATGVVLYEMLTVQVPFEADTPLAMLMKHAYEPPPSPRSLNPGLPIALEATVLHALAKDPAARYQSASEMAAALEHAAARIEQTRAWSQVTELYQAGVQAFAEGRWDAAIERLSRLSALDPTYEDSAELLAAAQAHARAAAGESIDLLRQPPQRTTEQLSLPITPPLAPGALPEAPHPAASDTAPAPSPVDVTAPPQAHTLPRPIRPQVWFAMGGMAVLLVLIVALVLNSGAGQSKEPPTPSPPSVQQARVAVQTMTIRAPTTTIGVPALEIITNTATMAAVPTAGATPMTKATPTETVPPTSTTTPVPPSATSTNTNTPRPTRTPRPQPTNTPQLDTPTPPPPPPPPPPTETPSTLVATIVHPAPGEYEPAATTELVFQAEAYDQTKGTNDGDGIDNIDMYIYDSNNVEVYRHIEHTPHYCAFSGDSGGPCPAFNFAKCHNTWATTDCKRDKGKPIVSGDYMLRAIVTTQDGRTKTVEGKVKVQLALP